jgi:hypothetical protein
MAEQIIPRASIVAAAQAAADRGECTNPFPAMTERYDWFKAEYRHRHDELSPA